MTHNIYALFYALRTRLEANADGQETFVCNCEDAPGFESRHLLKYRLTLAIVRCSHALIY